MQPAPSANHEPRPAMSVVMPAHNEERGIARTLAALAPGDELEVVVVCNGCTDQTARAASAAFPRARVLELAQPSKAAAVRAGNEAATVFPRAHVDADVEISAASLAALRRPILEGQAHATAPRREVPRDRSSRAVRWYYDVWEELPQVRSGLFGRGVVVLSEEGQRRVSALPPLMGDDLVMSEVFAPEERLVVDDAVVVVRPPTNLGDLLARRVRVATGNAQASGEGVRTAAARTSLATLVRVGARRPVLVPKIVVFLAVAVVARRRARSAVRRADFTTWHRDESSRGI